MIVRITFKITDPKSDKQDIILFGNSYKKWFHQFEEFLYANIRWWDEKQIMKCDVYRILKVESCKSNWIGWGGLKWCWHDHFQNELNREGCQEKDPDNPNPRQYGNMVFVPNPYMFNKCNAALLKRLRHLKDATEQEIFNELYHPQQKLENSKI